MLRLALFALALTFAAGTAMACDGRNASSAPKSAPSGDAADPSTAPAPQPKSP